jgi:hypothetical protein
MGQKAKYSLGADVFRFTTGSRHLGCGLGVCARPSRHIRKPQSEIYVKCGWGGGEVDDATPPVEMTTVGSFWGHKGLFEDIGAPPSVVPDVGTRRAPVQVIEGNYQRMAGICPWWDQTRGKTR